MKFFVYFFSFFVLLAITIQWKWPTSNFDFGLIKNNSICNSAIDNRHICSLNFFPEYICWRTPSFCITKLWNYFCCTLNIEKTLQWNLNAASLFCVTYSTTPFDSFSKWDFSCKWPCCFWGLLLVNLFCTVFLCLYSESHSEDKVIIKDLFNGRYFEKFLSDINQYIEASKTAIMLAYIFPNK